MRSGAESPSGETEARSTGNCRTLAPSSSWRHTMKPPTASAEAKAATTMTDGFLLRVYERIGGELGSSEAEVLLVEIGQRGLEV